jgi:hypothetical protein
VNVVTLSDASLGPYSKQPVRRCQRRAGSDSSTAPYEGTRSMKPQYIADCRRTAPLLIVGALLTVARPAVWS